MTSKTIILPCTKCGKERPVRIIKGKPRSTICRNCALHLRVKENNPNWKGHLTRTKSGKIYVVLYPGDKFFEMGYKAHHGKRIVARARLMVALYLNRPLRSNEDVHHKNGISKDDRLKNFQLLSDSEHIKMENLIRKIKSLKYKLESLESELKELENAGISFDQED